LTFIQASRALRKPSHILVQKGEYRAIRNRHSGPRRTRRNVTKQMSNKLSPVCVRNGWGKAILASTRSSFQGAVVKKQGRRCSGCYVETAPIQVHVLARPKGLGHRKRSLFTHVCMYSPVTCRAQISSCMVVRQPMLSLIHTCTYYATVTWRSGCDRRCPQVHAAGASGVLTNVQLETLISLCRWLVAWTL
jgi:hypothetical protein